MTKRALIVDDEEIVARLLKKFFSSLGWEADTAESGAAALKAFEPGRYGVVVCDVDLGMTDGLALAGLLSELEPGLNVIVMSGRPDNLERARAAGFARALAKPFNWNQLKDLISLPVEHQP